MTERPILYSGSMIRAILDGRKTQTRRVVKNASGAFWDHGAYAPYVENGQVKWIARDGGVVIHDGSPRPHCPYGKPGDRLWVRETWSPWSEVVDCGEDAKLRDARARMPWACILYGADRAWSKRQPSDNGGRWRPSIYMPRWASRLTIDVTEVRVERLQAITEEDAIAEGTLRTGGRANLTPADFRPARDLFRDLWDAINGKRAPWASNPWVWVVGFRRVEVAP